MDRRIALVILLLPAGCSDEPVAPIVDPPLPDQCFETCFDMDPCTDDLCQTDGTCLHVPANPFGACQTAAHCDDGNPCTHDTCELDGCGNMRCNSPLWTSGCQPCFMGCDDGNPCTVDSCGEDGICIAGPAEASCDAMCRWTAAQWPGDAYYYYDPSGATQRYLGVVAPTNGLNCATSECTCESPLSLGDGGVSFNLRNGTTDTEEIWTCDVAACDPRRADCTPMKAGVAYVVWGTMRYLVLRASAGAQQVPQPSDTAPAPDMTAVPPLDALEVQGYCLSARYDHMPGRYAATFESDGLSASFELTVDPDFGPGAIGRMGPCAGCAAMGVPELQQVQFDPSTDRVGLSFAFQRDGATGHAWLYSGREAFSGDVRTAQGEFAGLLRLERIAP